MPTCNHSDTNRQPFKRSGKKHIWNGYGSTPTPNPASCFCLYRWKRMEY